MDIAPKTGCFALEGDNIIKTNDECIDYGIMPNIIIHFGVVVVSGTIV
jgi:hypothetical protein